MCARSLWDLWENIVTSVTYCALQGWGQIPVTSDQLASLLQRWAVEEKVVVTNLLTHAWGVHRVRYATLIVTYETWMSHTTQLGVTYENLKWHHRLMWRTSCAQSPQTNWFKWETWLSAWWRWRAVCGIFSSDAVTHIYREGEGGEAIARKLSRRSGRSICSRQTNMSTEMGAVAMLGKKCALHQVHHWLSENDLHPVSFMRDKRLWPSDLEKWTRGFAHDKHNKKTKQTNKDIIHTVCIIHICMTRVLYERLTCTVYRNRCAGQTCSQV